MGAKSQNPKKSLDQNLTPQKSHAEFPSIKNFQKALNDVTITNLQIVLITQKKYFVKIFLPQKVLKSKNILRSSLSLEIRSTPPGFQ